MVQDHPSSAVSSSTWKRREPLIRRFEAAWLRGERPAIDDYLPADAADRPAVLLELVHADLECRLRVGEAVRVETYLQRYPDLAADSASVIDLIVTEFDLRRRGEPDLDPDSYYLRFPQFAAELASRWRSDAETKAVALGAEANLPRVPGYDVLGFLARGGMGAVYQARQQRLDRIVALKVLAADHADQPNFIERFGREARALARLNHPHIIAVHDFGDADGLCYLVMEYVDGQDLRQLMRGGPLRPELALRILSQVCAALQFAHEEGIIHRDIKPENVLLDKKGNVKVADFGLAKLRVDGASLAPLTGSEQVVGTLHYMAPEQLRRPDAVDARVDIYALGVLLYEMLTGTLPLGRFAPPSSKVAGVDGRLDGLLFQMLEQEPERRCASVAEVQAVLQTLTVAAPAPVVPATVAARGLTLRFFLGAFGVFVLAWLVLAVAANHGLAALLAAGALATGLACTITGTAVRQMPALRQELAQRRRQAALVNTGLAVVLFALGLGTLISSYYAWWDQPMLDPGQFTTVHRGQEQRLLQQLAAYEGRKPPDLPEVETVTLLVAFSSQERLAWWMLLSGGMLVLGAFLLCLETERGRNTWALHWQPALVLGAAVLLPPPVLQVLAGTIGTRTEAPQQSGGAGLDITLVKPTPRRLTTSARMEQVIDALRAWSDSSEYEVLFRGVWALETLRERRVLARAMWLEVRSRSTFDRWRLTWHGPERRRPLLRIQCLCGVAPAEARITIDPGPVREGSREPEEWRAVLDDLQEALRTPR
jgi:tRNA A-37 threonylcarbamoyl transferase component Bud32